jgi:hypothetical protein
MRSILFIRSRKRDNQSESELFIGTRRRTPFGNVFDCLRHWAGDMTNFTRQFCERALAHVVENETEAAYRRSDALAKRRLSMDEWAA